MRYNFFFNLALILAASWTTAASASGGKVTLSEEVARGFPVTVTVVPSPGTEGGASEAIRQALKEGQKIYRELDARGSGEAARINQNAGKGPVKVGEDLRRLFRVCQQIYEWSGGLFDVVKARHGKEIPDLRLEVDFEKGEARLSRKGTYLDFYGILKGYVIDRIAGLLKGQGYTDFMIRSGEDYRTMGKDSENYWRVTIPDPEGKGKMLCRLSLESASMATADIRDIAGARFRVGRNPAAETDLKSVTVITKNATNATALSATALVHGKAKAREIFSRIASPEEDEGGFGAILEDQGGKITTIGDVTAACFEE